MYTAKELQEAIENSECWSDVCRLLNVTICTYNFKRMQKICAEYSISYEKFKALRNKTFRRNKKYWDDKDIYCKSSEYPRCSLRRKILSDNFMPYKCCSCGNDGKWLGKTLTLEIEHDNGVNNDHRKNNLKWLCPNCHSQTNTYRNPKNRKGLVA